jgi:archaellum component FlaC
MRIQELENKLKDLENRYSDLQSSVSGFETMASEAIDKIDSIFPDLDK